MLEPLLERYRQRDRLALSRLLTLLARGEHVSEILAALGPATSSSLTTAITGSAGVGKSSLIGRLIETIRASGQTVAVLACDPQSPLSGGALLGDRFRMPSRPEDDGVFIRSLAAAGGHGAVAEHLDGMIRLLETFGFDVVLLETVGAGQGDTAVRELVDVVVLLLQPETGDDLQWEKAGVLEVADVLVVHKGDLANAANVEAQVTTIMSLGVREVPPIMRVSSRTGEGIDVLWQTIRACRRRGRARAGGEELLRLAQQMLAERYSNRANEAASLVDAWRAGDVPGEEAVKRFVELLLGSG
jgi:LAO/AO transport system ATPase